MPTNRPEPIDAFVQAMNAYDGAALLGLFADDAMVNDIRREFWGKDAIRGWIDREIVGDKVTMVVISVREHYGEVIVSGRMDGEYDKTNVPDPLILTFYFLLHRGRIVRLIILHNKPVA